MPRRQQYFSVWIRPVVPGDAQFALRAGLYEVQRLRDEGMTEADFELTRDFVLNYSKLWAQSLQNRLGFTMDSKFYGTPYYIDEIQARLSKLTVGEVNAAIKKYLSTDNYEAVVVTANAQQLKDTLQKDDPSPKTYNARSTPRSPRPTRSSWRSRSRRRGSISCRWRRCSRSRTARASMPGLRHNRKAG